MSAIQIKRARVLRDAAQAVLMESLERRRLLTTCTGTNNITILGNDSVDNKMTISFNSGTGLVSVTDGAAIVTNCTNLSVSSIKAFGGNSTSPSYTGTGDDLIDA